MEIIAGREKKERSLNYYLVQALILIAIVALGLLAVNQTLSYFYKAQLLKAPCDLCKELNPGLSNCINNPERIYRINNITINLSLISPF